MEPQIRYVRSDDGTSIAYSTLGRGRPLVWIIYPTSMQTIGVDPYVPRVRQSLNRLAERRMVVRVDPRGRGLSDRNVTDRSLDAYVADVSCVIHLLQGPVDLVADGNPAIGIACAARQPGRVRKLVLASPTGPAAFASPRGRVVRDLADIDFDLFKQVLALVAYGWDEGKAMAQLLTDLTHDEWAAAALSVRELDATRESSSVRCPTLVLHFRGANVPLDASRDLAASIADAEFRVLDTESGSSYDEKGLVASAIIEFLDRDDTSAANSSLPSGTAIILFADIVDSTALTERMGDAAFRERARALDESLRSIITESGGTTIDAKTLGDGVLATFPAASQAIDAALRCGAAGDACRLPLHLGLHAGDVIREANNVFGGAVNIASRISALSAPGEVLVSRTVADLARTSAGVTFEDRGEHALKGVADAQRVYAVRKDGA
jgi:class 3 adenylate cyclase